LRLACDDNALAQDSKTGMRIRTYKVAHQKLELETAFEPAQSGPRCHSATPLEHEFMPSKRDVVAVIDDNLSILGALSRLLSGLGYRTELYASAREFLDAALLTEAHCLIVDVHLGESCGIELARHLATAGFAIPIVFMTADNSESVKKRAAEVGCLAFLIKPFSTNDLEEALAKLAPRRIVGCERPQA